MGVPDPELLNHLPEPRRVTVRHGPETLARRDERPRREGIETPDDLRARGRLVAEWRDERSRREGIETLGQSFGRYAFDVPRRRRERPAGGD